MLIHLGPINDIRLTCGVTGPGNFEILEPRDKSEPNLVNPGHRTRAQLNITKHNGDSAYLVDIDHFVAVNGFCDAITVAVWTLDSHVGDVDAQFDSAVETVEFRHYSDHVRDVADAQPGRRFV